jgi:hypothetical protein
MGDKESVVWAKDDTEYLGLWWGGSQTYPEGGYGPVAGIMIGSYDSPTDDFTNDPSPADTKVTIGVNDANGNTLTWHFDRDGTTTFPTGSKISNYPGSPAGGDSWFVTPPSNAGGVASADGQQYVQVNNGYGVEIGTGWPASANAWHFGLDGALTLPGAVVNSTVAKTGADLTANDVLFQVTQVDGFGAVTEAVVTNSPNPLWVSNTSGLAIGDINFTVNFDGSGNATVIINSSGPGHNIGDTWTLPPEAVGATAPLPTAIDLTKSINKLTNGSYTLADGVEGQTMHLVAQTGTQPDAVNVTVANCRFGGTRGYNGGLYPFRILNDANASYFDSRGFCTLIFTDGAWQQSGGSWD